jgi:hypothetical protein
MTPRRFPPPWSVEEPDKLDRRCFIIRDANGHALATRRIAVNIAKLPELLR